MFAFYGSNLYQNVLEATGCHIFVWWKQSNFIFFLWWKQNKFTLFVLWKQNNLTFLYGGSRIISIFLFSRS